MARSDYLDARLLLYSDNLPYWEPEGTPTERIWGCPKHGPQEDGAWRHRFCPVCSAEEEESDNAARTCECDYYDIFTLLPPPKDGEGPKRIDGLPIALNMLAHACGLDASQGAIWLCAGDSALADYNFTPQRIILWILSTHDGDREWSDEDVPAFKTFDPRNSLTPRLALAAVINAKLWKKA